MSSNQISETPLPPEKKRCPHCGEIMAADAEVCWLCLEKYSVQEGLAPILTPTSLDKERVAADWEDSAGWRVVGFFTLALCVALAIEAPGILIVLLIVATPAVVRTVVVSRRAGPGGGEASVVGTFLGALGVAVLVGLASFVAFFATCFVVCLGGMTMADARRGGYDSILPASVAAGLVPGIAVAIYLFKAFWIKKG
jgi:hypothetical protein